MYFWDKRRDPQKKNKKDRLLQLNIFDGRLSKLIYFERWVGGKGLTALKEASVHTFIGANIKAKVRGWIGLPFNLFINAQWNEHTWQISEEDGCWSFLWIGLKDQQTLQQANPKKRQPLFCFFFIWNVEIDCNIYNDDIFIKLNN